jgi:hypothetical protein
VSLTDIGDYLETAVGLSLNTTLFLGDMPETGDTDVAAVFETPGSFPLETFRNDDPLLRTRLQVLTRSPSYASARDLGEDIFRALIQVTNEDLGSTFYHRITGVQSLPFDLPRDEDGRARTSCNYEVWREWSGAAS